MLVTKRSELRQVTFFIATSADGMIARENGEIDWIVNIHRTLHHDFYHKMDTLLMGRKTFEKILSQGPWPYNGKKTFIFSSLLKSHYGPEVKVVSTDAEKFVKELKAQNGGIIWLVGGAEIARYLMDRDLIDEVILDMHPHILGKGIQLFPLPLHSMIWELAESKVLNSSLIRVRYRLKSQDISFD